MNDTARRGAAGGRVGEHGVARRGGSRRATVNRHINGRDGVYTFARRVFKSIFAAGGDCDCPRLRAEVRRLVAELALVRADRGSLINELALAVEENADLRAEIDDVRNELVLAAGVLT